MLMESYDLWQLNSTRDLLRQPARATAKTALLLGNPSFDLTEAQQRAAVSQLGAPGAARSPDATVSPNGKLAALPATQDEVDQLSKTFQSAGWQVRELTGDMALKEAILRQQAPRVLHLATHGFFILSNPNIALDPLLRSGLVLASAGHTLAGSPPSAGLENGVLTSYETAQLNLQGSELVVLSACETGAVTRRMAKASSVCGARWRKRARKQW
jgi:CHAT domain-containing protein